MADQQPNVAEYVVRRLADLGIRHAFGVPGDYAFPFDDAFEGCKRIAWVENANELNAAYAADGYARLTGGAILCTTYAVGELSALNGVMGSKAERVPVFHLVGAPSTRLQRGRRITHHSLGDGVFGNFVELSAAAACAHAILTPENAITETERVITEALRESRPAYLTVAEDLALMPVVGEVRPGRSLAEMPRPTSDPTELAAALDAVVTRIEASTTPVILPACLISRFRLQPELLALLDATGIPFATTPMDKAVLDESHPSYMGTYVGARSAPTIQAAVEAADLILDVGGVVFSEYNTGAWTHGYDPSIVVNIRHDHVQVGSVSYSPVMLHDMLTGLAARLAHGGPREVPEPVLPEPAGAAEDTITADLLYPHLREFLASGDVVFSDTGLSTGPLTAMRLPEGVSFHYQTLWGSIGWATPAAFGASMADPTRRAVLITGDGGHQLTGNEIGAMGQAGATPIIIVLNNGVFGIEEALARKKGHAYDELAGWQYHKLPQAMGCLDWFTARVTTIGELGAALAEARARAGASYIEVVFDTTDALPDYGGEALDSIYETRPA